MSRPPHFLAPLRHDPRASLAVAGGAIVAPTVEGAFDSARRRRGLLGRDAMPAETAVVIAPSSAIHTFGMRFAIDVVFVARDGAILKVRPSVQPWRVTACWGAFAAIELAAGTTTALPLRQGDRLEIRSGAMRA